jgi:hypothetical protein
VDTGNSLLRLNGLPTIQQRGREMIESVKREVGEMLVGQSVAVRVAEAYGDLDLHYDPRTPDQIEMDTLAAGVARNL